MKATPKQLAYLRALADRTGETFAYPQTSQQASAEITRLKTRKATSRTERNVERRELGREMAERPADATRIRRDETAGYGSTATWTEKRWEHDDYQVGQRTELARYTITDGERVVYGQRVDGIVRVTDRPASGHGRSYLIERGLTTRSELNALVADYVAVSVRRDRPAVLVDLDAAAVDPSVPADGLEAAYV